ncbi:hypothetical protein NPIL_91711 [Nephila pilipes]|uniref:Uncharacterized protein n=1 Tax=Nephila pilipes TaxID=299642 RepID=A0A8X6NXV2_NEPPI|nr:hypothetical protein NPIL_91711 [Nephila pilipes]
MVLTNHTSNSSSHYDNHSLARCDRRYKYSVDARALRVSLFHLITLSVGSFFIILFIPSCTLCHHERPCPEMERFEEGGGGRGCSIPLSNCPHAISHVLPFGHVSSSTFA